LGAQRLDLGQEFGGALLGIVGHADAGSGKRSLAAHAGQTMMRPMREGRWSVLPLLFVAACAGASPDPRAASVDDLPPAAADAAERAQALELATRAVAAWRSTRTTEAAGLADAALARDPRCGRALAVRALLRWLRAQRDQASPALRDANAAETALRQAVAAAPQDAFPGLALATFLGNVDHLSAAAEAAEAALERVADARAGIDATDRADLLVMAAACRFELGEEHAALPHLQAYVALRPDDAAQQYRLGVTLLVLAATPQGPAPTSLLVAQRQAEAAARAFGRAFAAQTNDAEAGAAVATAWLRVADLAAERAAASERTAALDAASAQARALTARFPADPTPWWLFGVAAERGKDPVAAATAFDEALRRQPTHAGSLLHRAALADEAGDAALARSLLQRALDADAASPCLGDAERKRVAARVAQP
jgi:tetratricopeptide (TPR) repeat protein